MASELAVGGAQDVRPSLLPKLLHKVPGYLRSPLTEIAGIPDFECVITWLATEYASLREEPLRSVRGWRLRNRAIALLSVGSILAINLCLISAHVYVPDMQAGFAPIMISGAIAFLIIMFGFMFGPDTICIGCGEYLRVKGSPLCQRCLAQDLERLTTSGDLPKYLIEAARERLVNYMVGNVREAMIERIVSLSQGLLDTGKLIRDVSSYHVEDLSSSKVAMPEDVAMKVEALRRTDLAPHIASDGIKAYIPMEVPTGDPVGVRFNLPEVSGIVFILDEWPRHRAG